MTPLPRHLVVALLTALAAIAIATRWKIIAEHASPVPFHDQWTAEGTAMFEPWFAGKLRAEDFWKASNEHRPVLTRALAFAEFRLTGEWNTRLEMLVNSLFYALTAVVLALIARNIFGTRGFVASAVILALLFSLPCAYENAMWGFQSQFYLMMLLGAAYLGGTLSTTRIGRTWVLAQIAGMISLLTMGGAMLAPVVVGGLAAVRLVRRRDPYTIATLLVAAALAIGGWATIALANDPNGLLQSRSAAILVEALVKLLAWPSAYWFLVPLMLAPWLLVSVRALISREPSTGEVLLAALGGWILLQTASIAYGRGAHLTGIPPRYFDAFSVGLAVNAACLPVLLRARGTRIAVAVLSVAWIAAVGTGLWQFNKPSWIAPIIKGNGALQRGTLEAVRDYITTGDPKALTRDAFIAHHFPSISTMRRLLDNPGVRASLPATVRGESNPSSVERFTDGTLGTWPWVLGLGIAGLFSAGAVILTSSKGKSQSPASQEPVPWLAAAPLPALAAIVLIGCGMKPWDNDPRERFERIFDNAGSAPAGFDIPGSTGGIYPVKPTPGSLFFGTLIGGSGFTGEKVSTEFVLDHEFLIVPVTGYPNGPGSSLRLESLAQDGSVVRKFVFTGQPPRERIGVWSVPVGDDLGARARLVLADGSTVVPGWMGVGIPRLTDDPDAARHLEIALESVRAENARRFPAVLLAAAALAGGIGFVGRRRAATAS